MSDYMVSAQSRLLHEHFFAFEKESGKRMQLREFAKYLKIHESTLNLLLNDKRKMTARMAAYLARRTGDTRFYDLMHLPHPDPLFSYVSLEWPHLLPEEQQAVHDQIAKYRTGMKDDKEPART